MITDSPKIAQSAVQADDHFWNGGHADEVHPDAAQVSVLGTHERRLKLTATVRWL
jgi:hypothetical protein